jgi:hypothetical protein
VSRATGARGQCTKVTPRPWPDAGMSLSPSRSMGPEKPGFPACHGPSQRAPTAANMGRRIEPKPISTRITGCGSRQLVSPSQPGQVHVVIPAYARTQDPGRSLTRTSPFLRCSEMQPGDAYSSAAGEGHPNELPGALSAGASLPVMLHQQLVPVVEQEFMAVVKTNPRGCGKRIDVYGLLGCRCFLCAGSAIRHVGAQYSLKNAFGGNSASGHGLFSLEGAEDVFDALFSVAEEHL